MGERAEGLSFMQNLVGNVFIAILCTVAILLALAVGVALLVGAGMLLEHVLHSAGLVH